MPDTKFILTIDTEEDNQWGSQPCCSLRNIRNLLLLQELCEKYDVIPTYLVTYGVAVDPFSKYVLQYLLANSRCEIGTHLHPWLTPPYEHPFVRSAYPHTYPSECSYSLLRRKMGILTEAVSSILGRSPVSFRAGRYGLDGKVVGVLAELSYLVDSSVTPLYDWSTRPGTIRGGQCFVAAPTNPYYLDPTNILDPISKNTSRILEVPLTIRHSSDPDRPVWLRPYPWLTSKALLELCQSEIEENSPVLNMMFHSSELIAGGSPYTKTQEEVDAIYSKLTDIFAYLKGVGVRSLSLEMLRNSNEFAP